MCRQVASATAIVSWMLCGLLVVYGACLAIMTCVPQPPPPFDLEPELDTRVPVNSQTRHTPHLSNDSNTRLLNSDLEKQSGSAHPLLGSRNGSSASVGESMRIGRPMPLRRGLQPNASYSSSEYPVNAPQTAMRENDENLPFWPADESRSLDESRSYPPSYTSADATPRPLALRPGSIYSNSPSASSASVGFVNIRSSTLPPPQQSHAQKSMSRRTRTSSISNSVYSSSSRESDDFIPPVPLLDAYRSSSPGPQLISDAYRSSSPGPQLISDAYRSSSPGLQLISDASRTSSPRPQFVRPRADSGPWQQLVLDAAAGRRSIHLG